MYPIIHLGQYSFYSFGLMVGLGTVVSYVAFRGYFERHQLQVNVPVLCALIVIAGFLGAKLDYAVHYGESGLQGLFHRPGATVMRGGFTYFGGMFAAGAATALYLSVCRLPFLRIFDGLFCIAPAYAFGRIGCFLAGDGDYGVPTSLPWGISFPHGLMPTTARVHPTMLYITGWELVTFAVLWRLSNPLRESPLRAGMLLGSYLMATAGFRFLVEFLSRNPVVAFRLKEAQIVSVVLMLAEAGFLVRATWRDGAREDRVLVRSIS